MSKKVLSVVLVVAMLVSVFAVSAFASAPAAGSIGIRVTSDAKVGMKAGDVVNVKIGLNFPAGTDLETYRTGIYSIALGYNSDFYDYKADSFTILSDYENMIVLSAVTDDHGTVTTNLKKNATDSGLYGGDKASAVLCATKAATTGAVYTSNQGYPVRADGEFYTLQFEVQKDLTADAVIGAVNATLGKQTVVKYISGGKNVAYAATNIDVTEAVAAPAANSISFVKTQAQWVGGDNKQIYWNLGIVGKFSTEDIAIAFDKAGKSTNVEKVGVDVTVGDYKDTETTKYVYETATGEYSYRAVVTNIPYNVEADKTITVTFFAMVKPSADADPVKVTGETKTFNLADEFAAAQSRTPAMPAYTPPV